VHVVSAHAYTVFLFIQMTIFLEFLQIRPVPFESEFVVSLFTVRCFCCQPTRCIRAPEDAFVVAIVEIHGRVNVKMIL